MCVIVLVAVVERVRRCYPARARRMLTDLYNSTEGDGWKRNGGWKKTPLHPVGFALPGTEGGWYGVGVYHDHVVSLRLPGNNLKGVPPSGMSFHFPAIIDLSGNQLSGPISPGLLNQKGSPVINLSNNQLTGAIPTVLNHFKSLDLSCIRLSGALPAELGLLLIEMLDLSLNQLSGPIPPEWGNLQECVSLDISHNGLSGEIPVNLARIEICTADLGYNCLSAVNEETRVWLRRVDRDWESSKCLHLPAAGAWARVG